MFSATSLVLRSRRSLISTAGGTLSWIGMYVSNPTHRAFFTPPFVLRYFLSTTPDKDTSGSGSVSHLTTTNMTKIMKVGDIPNNILPEISSVMQTPLSADSSKNIMSASAISSGTPPRRYDPVDRDVEISSLKDTIKSKDVALMSLSEEIASVINERARLLKKEVLSSNESRRLIVIEAEDLPYMRKDKDRLVAEIAKHEAELSQLKHPKELIDAPVPAQGI